MAAVFGSQTVLADARLGAAVAAIESEIDDGSVAELAAAYDEPVDLDTFEAVERTVLPRRSEHPTDDYVRHLATVSAYLVLEPDARAETLKRIRELLPDRVELVQDVDVQLARRA